MMISSGSVVGGRYAPGRIGTIILIAGLFCSPAAAAQIPQDEFAQRRQELTRLLGDGLYYFEGAPAAAYDYLPWGQESNFFYLTGISEPDAHLIMVADRDHLEAHLFVAPLTPGREIWEAARLGVEGAARLTGMQTHRVAALDQVRTELARRAPPALISLRGPGRDQAIARLLEQMGSSGRGRGAPEQAAGVRWVNAGSALTQLRALKSPAEIGLLQTASDITRLAHLAAMQALAPGWNEFEIQAVIEFTFRRYGALRPGFASIVGSGPNSTVLHYNSNDRFMEAGEMLVIDIGAEYGRYTSDVTRSLPVSGRFSPEQRAIYEIVLASLERAEQLAAVQGTPYAGLTPSVHQVMAEGLSRLGLIEGPEARLPGSNRSQVSLYFMHGLGHGIGLDVHDSMPPTIEVGSCFTLEPGLYIREDALERIGSGPEADRLREKLRPAVTRFRNIGVRIEDSYAFTSEGLVRLSRGIPRTVSEVEAAMAVPHPMADDRAGELIERYRRLVPPPAAR